MKRNTKNTILIIALAVLALLGLVRLWPETLFDSALTEPDAPAARLVCYGYVDTRQSPLLLQPARAGRVIQVFVAEHQTVHKNMPLIQVDDHLSKLQEKEAALAVKAAQVQLAKALDSVKQHQARQAQVEAALEAARNKVSAAQYLLARKEQLVKADLIDQVEADVGRTQLNEARALVQVEQNKLRELTVVDPELAVRQAQVQLNRSQFQVQMARQECAQYVLRAPVDGLVLRVQVRAGELLIPTAPRPAVWLAPSGAWIVRAEVSQEFAGRVQDGLDALVEDEASGSVLARGRVGEVSDWFLPRRQSSALPTAVNTGLTLECIIELHHPHERLRLGQRVRVRLL